MNNSVFSSQDILEGKIGIESEGDTMYFFERLLRQTRDFFGLYMQQSPQALIAFSAFFTQVPNIARVIELGTGMGGLAILLGICAQLKHFEFYTFDNNPKSISPPIVEILQHLAIHRRIGSIHDELNSTVLDLITSSGVSVLLCDNGDKIKEFNMFAPYLKPGDYIFAHDFHESKIDFEEHRQERYWPHLEISLEDIQETITTCGLSKGMLYDTFLLGNWACFYKGDIASVKIPYLSFHN